MRLAGAITMPPPVPELDALLEEEDVLVALSLVDEGEPPAPVLTWVLAPPALDMPVVLAPPAPDTLRRNAVIPEHEITYFASFSTALICGGHRIALVAGRSDQS